MKIIPEKIGKIILLLSVIWAILSFIELADEINRGYIENYAIIFGPLIIAVTVYFLFLINKKEEVEFEPQSVQKAKHYMIRSLQVLLSSSLLVILGVFIYDWYKNDYLEQEVDVHLVCTLVPDEELRAKKDLSDQVYAESSNSLDDLVDDERRGSICGVFNPQFYNDTASRSCGSYYGNGGAVLPNKAGSLLPPLAKDEINHSFLMMFSAKRTQTFPSADMKTTILDTPSYLLSILGPNDKEKFPPKWQSIKSAYDFSVLVDSRQISFVSRSKDKQRRFKTQFYLYRDTLEFKPYPKGAEYLMDSDSNVRNSNFNYRCSKISLRTVTNIIERITVINEDYEGATNEDNQF